MTMLFRTLMIQLALAAALACPALAFEQGEAERFSTPITEQALPQPLPSQAQPDPVAEEAHPATEAHDEGHSSGGLPQLDPTWYASQVFWMVVIFAALYGIYGYSVLPALGGIIQTRRDRIQNDLDQAQLMKNEAEKLRRTYESSLHESHVKASALIGETEDSIKAQASAQINAFRAKSSQAIEAAEDTILAARKGAMEEMTVIAAEIASIAAKKIVGVTTDIDRAKSVVQSIHRKAA